MAGDIKIRVRKVWPSRPRGRLRRIGDPGSYLILQVPALERAPAFFVGAQSLGPYMLSGREARTAGMWDLGTSPMNGIRPCRSQQIKQASCTRTYPTPPLDNALPFTLYRLE